MKYNIKINNNIQDLCWNLNDLYNNINDTILLEDIKILKEQVEKFEAAYSGKLATLSNTQSYRALLDYESITELSHKIGSYAFLKWATALDDEKTSKFYQYVKEILTEISVKTLFFPLETNELSDDIISRLLEDTDLKHKFGPWLRDARAMKPHQLSKAEETILQEKSLTSSSAWVKLFDDTIADLRFQFRGENLSCSEAIEKLSDHDAQIRKEIAAEISLVFKNNIKLFAIIMNNIVKDKAIEDKYRNFKEPISSMNLSNYIEDEVVEQLINTVKQNYTKLAHRYYKLKAKLMGKEYLNYWDRNAPLSDTTKKIEWNEAVETVLDAYYAFSKELGELGKKFFENAWIDVPMRKGKLTGAFAHPVVPSVHPYLMLNYSGKINDVFTLAHELGHGVHMLLAGSQGPLVCSTPLTLSETASVFGEQLTFRYLLNKENDSKEKAIILAKKIEDMLNTVVRQIAFCDFEKRIHAARKEGELSADDICAIWMDVSRESLGESVELIDDYKYYWAYISHFIHSPFYVYSYAFGDCLVNSLYKLYQNQTLSNFEDLYLKMLQSGGRLWHRELLQPFGIDASDANFWQGGLDIVAEFIDELEASMPQ